MSLKPTKKSDRNKEWLKPRADKKILIPPEYHLIVTEGTKTEPNYFLGLKIAIDKKDGGRYHAIWSNQCIELWFLLHFQYMDSDIARTEYYTKLSKCMLANKAGNYCKNRDDIFDCLKPYMETAIANAKKLEQDNEGRVPSACTPGTKVYQIFEKLKKYL